MFTVLLWVVGLNSVLRKRAIYVTQRNEGFITGQCSFKKTDGFMWLFFRKRY
jgi:hypothetical protein